MRECGVIGEIFICKEDRRGKIWTADSMCVREKDEYKEVLSK